MKRLLKEPLLHFLLLGGALFAFDALVSDRTARAGSHEILVSKGRIDNLAALFAKTWQRAPSSPELRELVDDFVLEEALYREGTALGVDQDDTIIRRRVRQKMEFVVDDIIEQAEPDEGQLERWLAEHRESYASPETYRFRQLYLNPERHGDDLDEDAAEVLARLRSQETGLDPRGLGDPSLLEHAFADMTAQAVVTTFGQGFADELSTLPMDEWTGPVESAFGLHLVLIDAQTPGESYSLDAVRDEVARDWAFAQREVARARFNQDLLARYEVSIEWPAGVELGQ
ncbi:MAG: hypothetical protein ACI8QZ_000190 [Chlamydiales bacterium]|jgi:hypothetical protein